jgi:hypothetical protein
MSSSTETQRLAVLIEDLTSEIFEASRAQNKNYRDLISLAEQTLATAKEALEAIRNKASDEGVNVSLKPATLIKFVPWVIAAMSAILEAFHRLH